MAVLNATRIGACGAWLNSPTRPLPGDTPTRDPRRSSIRDTADSSETATVQRRHTPGLNYIAKTHVTLTLDEVEMDES